MKTYYVAGLPYSDELWHHGIKGQKWGIRRYMNKDGTLTAAGKARYGTVDNFRASQKIKKSASSRSSGSSVGSFVSRHKKGIAIAGGLLAVGIGAIIVSKAMKNGDLKRGADAVNNVLSGKNGYKQEGTVFSVKGSKGTVSGYLSPEYAKFLRNMNNGSLPGSHANNFISTTKAYSDFMKK